MSQKTIAVLGATGVQGGSVVQALLKDKTWKVRGLTRDTSKDAAKALEKQGVELVSANIDDEGSLLKAFEVRVCYDLKPLMRGNGPQHILPAVELVPFLK